MKRTFQYSLENLRGLAILFVMFSHFRSFHALGDIGKYIYFFVSEATSWFVFLSGYFFFHIEKNRFQYRDYLGKKLKYVILPYLILSVPAILAGIYLGRDQLLGISRTAYACWSLVVGGAMVVPMWFVPMILIFFLFSPVFIRIANSRLVYIIAIAGIVLSLFTFRPLENLNPGLSFLHFLGFYLLGLAFARASEITDMVKSLRLSLPIILSGSLGFVLAIWLFDDVARYDMGFYDAFGMFNVKQFGKLSLLVALFFFFDKFLFRKNRFLGHVAEISFGLFFIHGFFMIIFLKLVTMLGPLPPVVSLFSEIIVVVGFSIIAIHFLKFILRKWSRYVIGC